MIVSELRLIQSIRAGKYGEENYFNQSRQPGIVIRRLDGYFSVEFEGETYCTEAVNVRQWSPGKATADAIEARINDGLAAAHDHLVKRRTRGPNKPRAEEPADGT